MRRMGTGAKPGTLSLSSPAGFILSGRIAYQFDNHRVEAGPGDMLHIPAGRSHRYKPRVIGTEVVRYLLTEFG